MSRGSRKPGKTCRCSICHRKDAGSNRCRKSYIAVGLTKSEGQIIGGAYSKKNSRKVRRLREKLSWQYVTEIAY